MNRSIRLPIAVAVTLSFAITGAHLSSPQQVSAAGKPTLKRGITLSIWDFFQAAKNTPERVQFEKIVSTWEKKTGNHVKFLGLNPGAAKVCVAGPAGQGADIIGMPHDQLADLTACKTVAAVPSWAFPKSLQQQYIKPAIQGVTLGGKLYGMPWAIETTGIFYNKALIPSSFFTPYPKGVPLPKLAAKAQSLTKNGNYGLVYDINNFYDSYAFIAAGGGYVFKYVKGKGFDYHQLGLDSAGTIRGWQAIKDISSSGKYKLVPSTMTGPTALSSFDSGKAAMYISGPWDEADLKAKNIKFGFAPDPALDSSHPAHPFSGVQIYSVNKYSKYANEAFDLVQFISQNTELPLFKTEGRIPVLKKLLSSKTVQSDPVAKVLGQEALIAQPMPNIAEMAQVWTPAGNALTLITKGSISPADAAHQTATAIQQAIAKAHGG